LLHQWHIFDTKYHILLSIIFPRKTEKMDDLDALLLELEATIPSQAKKDDDIPPQKVRNSNGTSTLQGNLTELDSLLEDLYNTDDVPVAKPPSPQVPAPPVSVETPPLVMNKKQSVNIDSMLEELEETDMSSKTTTIPQQEVVPEEPAAAAPTATSAAQQLDDLMASLVGFQLDPRDSTASDKSDPPYAKPDKSRSKPAVEATAAAATPDEKKSNDLDEMLKQMNTNLDAEGIRAASKGNCGGCGKPVMGEATTALGKVWHPWCFTCVVCDDEIGKKTFFEREGKPYCEGCYHKLFSPSCAYCNKPVLGQCVTALNKTWHPEHFFCAMCNNFFGEDGFHEYEGKPYCRPDYYNLFAPKCGGCLKPILTNYISAMGKQWHPECFVCRECGAPFTNGSFFELDGQPYCETHYHSLRGSLCYGCQKPITGRCITAMGKKFHPDCFVCAFCLKQLNKGTFKEQNEKPYCHQCFTKLFGKAM